MSEIVWVSLILVISWAALPISLIVANEEFDDSVARDGEDPFSHCH